MAHFLFHIEVDGTLIRYDPDHGMIINESTHEIIRIARSQNRPWNDHAVTQEAMARSFKPNCLTVYLSNQCNLACSYCYIDRTGEQETKRVNISAVEAASEFVALACRSSGQPFVMGFHGGNEPLTTPDLARECIGICRKSAQKYGLRFFTYCTTNGVIPRETAEWAAGVFTGIRLSWDGPPDIHDRYRKDKNGMPTSAAVRNSAGIFFHDAASASKCIVRTTITGYSVKRMQEIAEYFQSEGVREFEIYPVFTCRREAMTCGFIPDPLEFLQNYFQARQWASRHRMKMRYTGTRFSHRHGRHCPVLQDNLTITSDGYCTPCFMMDRCDMQENGIPMIGRYNEVTNRLDMDWPALAGMIRLMTAEHPKCRECFNRFHCSKGCPDYCPLESGGKNTAPDDCRIDKLIGLSQLLEESRFSLPDSHAVDMPAFLSGIPITRIG